MTTDRDDASLRRYRAANAALDERPSEATRAAILAAAARRIEARPQDATAAAPVRRRRWPLAAAAAVLLSTLAVMLATRTEHEMPTFTEPGERAAEQVATPPPASVVAPMPSAESSAPSPPMGRSDAAVPPGKRVAPPAEPSPPARLKKSAPAGESAATAPGEAPRSVEASEPKVAAGSSKAASAELQAAPPPAPAAAPPAPSPPVARAAPAPATAAAPPLTGGLNEAAKAEGEVAADRAMRRESAPAGAAAQNMAGKDARQNVARDFERTPAQWLDYIVRLRGAGRHAEADAELKRFRERFPDAPVPPAALLPAPTGTR